MKMTIGIYKITNKLNNKCYIGQSVHIERRWQEHCLPSAKSAIALAIKKYGKDNFSFEVLEECLIEELDAKEDYYMKFFNSLSPNGYNILTVKETINARAFIKTKADAEYIIEDILYSNLTFKEIADKYHTSTRAITRLNNGYTFYNDDLKYPLRVPNNYYEKQHSYCIDCGKEITLHAKRCVKCDKIAHRKVERPSREKLKELIRNKSFTQIGRIYGVSDNSIRKWCANVNLPTKKNEIKTYSDKEWDLI